MDSPEKALEFKKRYNGDGIMIGRASIGNPWIFNEIKHYLETGQKLDPPSLSAKINAVKQHVSFSVEWKGDRKGINEMRRHYTNYFRGIPNFKPYRNKLVQLESQEEIFNLLDEIKTTFVNELSLA